jgi:hypothetical protein
MRLPRLHRRRRQTVAPPARSTTCWNPTMRCSAPPAGPRRFVADLPSDESRERLSAAYLEEARRAARQGRRVTTVESGGRKGIGKGPLIASAVLTVAVAGGAAFTVMRGKQEAQGDDFARLDPAAPLSRRRRRCRDRRCPVRRARRGRRGPCADRTGPRRPSGTRCSRCHAARITCRQTAAAAAAAPAVTLDQAVRDGDPVALHDYALELLQSARKRAACNS